MGWRGAENFKGLILGFNFPKISVLHEVSWGFISMKVQCPDFLLVVGPAGMWVTPRVAVVPGTCV